MTKTKRLIAVLGMALMLLLVGCSDSPQLTPAPTQIPTPCPVISQNEDELHLRIIQQQTIITNLQTEIMEKNKTINNLLHVKSNQEGSPRREE